ncbi:unnamed protein product, partial [Adineta ricciae]
MKNKVIFLYFFAIFVVIHGQLSIDELFLFTSKYTLSGNCTDFQYNFSKFRVQPNVYNQLTFDCQSSELVLRNQDSSFSSICPTDEKYGQTMRIHFNQPIPTSIQVNQLQLYGIELCSLDELLRNVYPEHSYYRSRWALLINLDNNDKNQQHLAIATDGGMTFMLFLLSPDENSTIANNQIDLIFPGEQSFRFNQSRINVWQVDPGYVRSPRSVEFSDYQLSKTTFTLFDNETFVVYGTQVSLPRRFLVYVDDTLASCKYDYILQCQFPILPLYLSDTHQPVLKILYSRLQILNTTLTLVPRTRLHQVPTNHSLTEISTFEITLDENLCRNQSLKSLFTFIVHLWKEDVNGKARYSKHEKNDLREVECNATVPIGQEIHKLVSPLSIDDVISMDVDLIHQ